MPSATRSAAAVVRRASTGRSALVVLMRPASPKKKRPAPRKNDFQLGWAASRALRVATKRREKAITDGNRRRELLCSRDINRLRALLTPPARRKADAWIGPFVRAAWRAWRDDHSLTAAGLLDHSDISRYWNSFRPYSGKSAGKLKSGVSRAHALDVLIQHGFARRPRGRPRKTKRV